MWSNGEPPLLDWIPGVVWETHDIPRRTWDVDGLHHSANIDTADCTANGIRKACLAYLGQLALHRGRQLQIAGRRMAMRMNPRKGPLTSVQVCSLVSQAVEEVHASPRRRPIGGNSRFLLRMRWWEVAVLCLIVLGEIPPNRFGILMESSAEFEAQGRVLKFGDSMRSK